MNSKELAAKLRLERRIRDLTQSQLADIVGVDRDDISAYETERRNPRFDTFVAWAEGLGYELTLVKKP